MIELAHHIETLLLENDCVIIPGLGGFVAHYTSASHTEGTDTFLPPARLVGFNPQLQMNDGLLVQSFMTVYATNFPDATKMVEKKVEELIATLHQEGKADLPNVGELSYTIHGNYNFVPYDYRINTPGLYGLGSFEMSKLSDLRAEAVAEKPQVVTMRNTTRRNRRMHLHIDYAQIAGVAAMIAILVASFLFSTPIENTEVTEANYAQLLPGDLFDRLEKQSLAITPIVTHRKAEVARTPQAREVVLPAVSTPAKAKESEKASAPSVKATSEPSKAVVSPTKKYHIIVASVGTEKDATQMAGDLKSQGNIDAQTILGDGKKRVSIASYATYQEAIKGLEIAKQSHAGAWILKK